MNTRPNVTHLSKSSISNTNSVKYFIDCSRISNEELTTEKWLEVETRLKPTNFDDKNRVLLGFLKEKNRKRVVIKIGESETLEKEYKISHLLHEAENPGFITFLCFFKCNDNFKEHPDHSRPYLCKGPGTQMSCLVMPYYPKGNMYEFPFRSIPNGIDILKSLLKVTYISLTNAYASGVLHNDLHCKNILVAETSIKAIHGVPIYGYRPVIMDLENAFLIQSQENNIAPFVFKDFNRLLADLEYNSQLGLESVVDLTVVVKRHSIQKPDFVKSQKEIFQYIDRLSFGEIVQLKYEYNPNIY